MLRTPSYVVERICFWSFVKSQEITTDSDSLLIKIGSLGFLMSYKIINWSLPQVATSVESLFQTA